MPIVPLTDSLRFPNPNDADASGLVAYGGDLNPDRLLAAYAQGLFPWPHGDDLPLLWFSPDPRTVLVPADLHVSRSLRKTLRQGRFTVRFDSAFDRVVHACAVTRRSGQDETWITPPMRQAYSVLHQLGFAHSAEAWFDGRLVGGVYGVSLGAAFFAESMFTHLSNAAKVAFVHLVRQLEAWGFSFLDCQVHTEHVTNFGAVPWARAYFLNALAAALRQPTRRGLWAPCEEPGSPTSNGHAARRSV